MNRCEPFDFAQIAYALEITHRIARGNMRNIDTPSIGPLSIPFKWRRIKWSG